MNITQNAAFASNVEVLVYDARLFWAYMEVPTVYHEAYKQGFPLAILEESFGHDQIPDSDRLWLYDEDYCSSASKYSRLLSDQNQIFNDQKDLEVLRTGLKQLRNLKRISILDQFRPPFRLDPYSWDESKYHWYDRWSDELCEGIAEPTTWAWASSVPHELHLRDFPWDFRGVTNLLIAIREYGPRLRSLDLGCKSSMLSLEIYSREEHAEILCEIAPQLTSFKLTCEVSFHDPNLLRVRPYHIKAITRILEEAKSLENLTLKLSNWPKAWSETSLITKCSHLRVLDLEWGSMEAASFRAFINTHTDTLRELRVRCISISGKDSWEKIAEELGRSLRLHMLALSCIIEQSETRDRDDYDLGNVAYLFMQRLPRHIVGLKKWKEESLIAWDKQNFMPAYDLNTISENDRRVSW